MTELPTLETLSAIIGVSQRTIRRCLFNEAITYRELLNRIRFDAACAMLDDEKMLVTDIAFELGYSGPNNFVRAFQRIAGMTPSKYRERRGDK